MLAAGLEVWRTNFQIMNSEMKCCRYQGEENKPGYIPGTKQLLCLRAILSRFSSTSITPVMNMIDKPHREGLWTHLLEQPLWLFVSAVSPLVSLIIVALIENSVMWRWAPPHHFPCLRCRWPCIFSFKCCLCERERTGLQADRWLR